MLASGLHITDTSPSIDFLLMSLLYLEEVAKEALGDDKVRRRGFPTVSTIVLVLVVASRGEE
jgi:hypothetical protein